MKRRFTFGDVSTPTQADGTSPVQSTQLDYAALLNPQITPEQNQAIQGLVNQIPQTYFTVYLTPYGDEPPASVMTVDITQYMQASDYQNLSQSLRYLPRANLKAYMDQFIAPTLPAGDYYNILWKALINLFNSENLDEVNKRQITPQTWEAYKTKNYSASGGVPSPIPVGYDPVKQQNLALRYQALPKIASQEIELRRQAAITGLLSQAEYDAAHQIIAAYEAQGDHVNGVLTDPTKMSVGNTQPAQTQGP